MDLAAALLAIMLAWPAPADEPNVDRVAWLTTVAAAIEEAALEATCTHQGADHTCKPSWPGAADELATLLAVKAYRESGLRQRIARGECKPYECDARWNHRTGEHLGFRAHSMWQIHASPVIPGRVPEVSRDDWRAMLGTDLRAVKLGASLAARILGRGMRACGSVAGAIGQYGGATCGWAGSAPRTKLYGETLAKVRRLQRAPMVN